MKTPSLWISLVVLGCLLSGCGGSRSSSPGTGTRTGPARGPGIATFSIEWPKTTRLIPDDTKYIKIEIFDPQTPNPPPDDVKEDRVAVLVIERPNTTAEARNLPLGNLYAVVQAFKEHPGVRPSDPPVASDPRIVTAEERIFINSDRGHPLAVAKAPFATTANISTPVNFTLENAVKAIKAVGTSAIVLGRKSAPPAAPTVTVQLFDSPGPEGKTVLVDPKRLVWESLNKLATVDLPGTGYEVRANGENLGVVLVDSFATLRVKYFALDADLADPQTERATAYADFQVPVTPTVGFAKLMVEGPPPPGTQTIRVEFFGNDRDPNKPNQPEPVNGNILYNFKDFSWKYNQANPFQTFQNLDDLIPGMRRVVVTAWSGETGGTGFKLGSKTQEIEIMPSGDEIPNPDTIPRQSITTQIENWVTDLSAAVSPSAVVSGFSSQLILTIGILEPHHEKITQPLSTEGFLVTDNSDNVDPIGAGGIIPTRRTGQVNNIQVQIIVSDPRWTQSTAETPDEAKGRAETILTLTRSNAGGAITIR